VPEISIVSQTFRDLTTWLISPDEYSTEQLSRLIDEDLCLPLIALASRYWLIGWLTHSLKRSNAWPELPKQLQDYLLDVEEIYGKRNQMIKAEVQDICTLLSEGKVDIVLIKGAASLFNGTIEPLSKRYMNDIDLLVPEEQQQNAYQLLRRAGYNKDSDYYNPNSNDAHHAPPLKRNNVCYVELHRWLLEKHLNKVIDTKAVWANTCSLTLSSGLVVKQLNATQQVILSIAHSEIQNGGFDNCHIDFHQLMNLHSIMIHYVGEVNWQLVQYHFEQAGQILTLKTALYNAYKLTGIETPITDLDDQFTIKHFDKCIKRYVKRQGEDSIYSVAMEQFYLYKKRNIQLKYGSDVSFWYVKGVCKQLKNHADKAFNQQHLSLLIKRLRH
jgi:hypothetical protein